MAYKLIWDKQVSVDLKSIDKHEAKRIINKAQSFLVEDPINLGKLLSGQYKGLYRYRIGDYRLIYSVDKEAMLVKVYTVAHRKVIYSPNVQYDK